MYAASIVEKRLALCQEELGFPLEYHSPEEISLFNRTLEKKYEKYYTAAKSEALGKDDDVRSFRLTMLRTLGNLQSPVLNRDEVRFIQNERAVILSDAAYFLTRYYYVLDEHNVRTLYKFRAGQRILFDVIAEMEARGIAIEILLAKARQLGMTTLAAGLELLKVMTSPGISGIIASADTGKTREMVDKTFYAYDSLPWWLAPITTRRLQSESGLIAFAGDSKLVFQHGKQTNPIAMGSTPITYHLSEVSSYPNAYQLIEEGLFKCVHAHPSVLGILESTCKGDTGWWHDSYWSAKRKWSRGQSRLMALFLPFYCDTGLYPNETFLRRSPLPESIRLEPETKQMVAESELYVQSNPLLEKVLIARDGSDGGHWRMRREQIWYWQVNFLDHKDKHAERLWYQEMPHTDKAAFQNSYDNVFGNETIQVLWDNRPTEYEVYAIVGQSIEDRYDPDPEDVDHTGTIVPVSYRHPVSGTTYNWELWPVKWQENFRDVSEVMTDDLHMGKLFVWEAPQPGYDYAIGVDTSNGIGSDSTCIAVSRRGRTPQERDVQVAEFRWNQVSHVEAFAWVMAIATYYSRYMSSTTKYREPYVTIEQIAAVGDTCQMQMQKMGYRRFHRMTRYDSTPKNMVKAKSKRVGWYTSAWSRPMLTDGFVTMVKNGWYTVNSPFTLREMTKWEVHFTTTGKEKYEHASYFTDDGIFSNAMCAFCPNDQALMAERSKKQWVASPLDGRMPDIDIDPRGGIIVPTDPIPTGISGKFRV